MSDPNTNDTQAAYAPAAEPKTDTSTHSPADTALLKPFPIWRLLVAGLITATVIAILQWFAPQFDYQIANMATLAVLLVFALFLLVVLQRFASSRGRKLLVPGLTIVAIALGITLVRFDGFSGELFPQLDWRFASEDHGRWQETQFASDRSDTESESAQTPESVATYPSHQFLGPDRNGVIEKRQFNIPASDADVKVLWDQSVGEGWSSFAIVGDRTITLEQRDEMECITCYRLSDGKLFWIDSHEARHENPLGGIGPRSTPTIVKGRVYAMGAMGFLRVIDVASGERIWTVDLLAEAGWTEEEFSVAAPWGNAQSPLVIESLGLVVVGFGGPVDADAADKDGMTDDPKSLIAFGLETGEVKWKAGRDQFSYASPMWMTLDGQDQIVSVNEKTVTGHLPHSGETLWSFAWPGQTNGGANCASAIAVSADRFVVGKGYGVGSVVVEATKDDTGTWNAEEIWLSSRVLKTKFTHPCIQGDTGFAISNGALQAVDLGDGTAFWNQSRGDRFGQGQVILVEDTLVCQSEVGDVVFVAADPDRYAELGRLDALGSKTWNIPTVAGRHLIVRNDRQAICYLLGGRESE